MESDVKMGTQEEFLRQVTRDMGHVVAGYPLADEEKGRSLKAVLVSYIGVIARQHYIMGHARALSSLNQIREIEPRMVEEALDRSHEFQVAFMEILSTKEREGPHWALDDNILDTVLDVLVTKLKKKLEGHDGGAKENTVGNGDGRDLEGQGREGRHEGGEGAGEDCPP